jgi:hypothetical protein
MKRDVISVNGTQARIAGWSGDPITRFSDSMRGVVISLEMRSSDELALDARVNPDAALREHALYQLVDKLGPAAMPDIETALFNDPDPQVRINLLWALETLDHERAEHLARTLRDDPSPRVQEWARVFCWEKGWAPEDFRQAKEARFYENRTFDETIFLHIKCDLYIRLAADNSLWGHIILSPQMLARVYGQAYACPITATREREIVIAKTLSGLHEDGSDHYEAFLFRGFTERTAPNTGSFYFETSSPRPFYLSGKADDTSEGVIENVNIPFAREGQWYLNPNLPVKGNNAIEYVRGLFQGWAYVNHERIQNSGGDFLFPGNSVLSTLHHPEVAAKTNTFISGSFKGKVVDWDGDGVLDLNYLQSPATAKGEVDSNFDGVPDVPGLTVCPRPLQQN